MPDSHFFKFDDRGLRKTRFSQDKYSLFRIHFADFVPRISFIEGKDLGLDTDKSSDAVSVVRQYAFLVGIVGNHCQSLSLKFHQKRN